MCVCVYMYFISMGFNSLEENLDYNVESYNNDKHCVLLPLLSKTELFILKGGWGGLTLSPHNKKVPGSNLGPYRVDVSPRACVLSLRVLRLTPTLQRTAW